MKQTDFFRAIVLRNETCCYCGVPFSTSLVPTKEHVVGRRFVPKGTLQRCWNLIVQVCGTCNGRKSDLEDDISAISMQPGPLGDYPVDDDLLIHEATRKAAKSKSRRTGKMVADSSEEQTFRGSLVPGATFSFTSVGPPQMDETRAWELGRLHVSAFFYLLTYDETTRRGAFWPGVFNPYPIVPRTDWGNCRIVAFMHEVSNWEPRFIGSTAAGFYRIAIRQKPLGALLWSWAVEWNKSYRLTGFFGDIGIADAVARSFPDPTMHIVSQTGDHVVRMRPQVPLDPAEDLLFKPE